MNKREKELVKELITAIDDFAEKQYAIMSSEAYQRVITFAYRNGVRYTGETYNEEFDRMIHASAHLRANMDEYND